MSDAPRTDFWKFWADQTISQLGSSFTFFALPLLVYKLTGSSVNLVAIALAFRFTALGHADDYLGTGEDAPPEGGGPLADPAVATRGGG